MLRSLLAFVTIFVTSTIAQQFYTYRLPNNTQPETYDISIQTWIDENNGTFIGSVRIGIIAVESTDFIRLHHSVQRLQRVTVLTADEVPISIGNYSYDAEFDYLTIPVVGNNLTQGSRYIIEIDYVGFMNAFSGFYRSSYFDDEDTRIWFGSTQFEATYARSAFPCYDEPARKANFTIRITHVSTYSAISNMPVVSETENADGSVTTAFETSPPMSTFLVAFHVSDFPHITSSPPRPIPQRMFSRSTAINATELALDAGELLIDALSDYVDIEYSLPKLDQIAVAGFPSGAMENWGMITYAEFYALYDESVDYFARSLYAVQTISHELAHQWFGNLVTPSWWTYLWMKEGFATFFEYFGVDLVYPDWQLMDFFVVDVTQSVLQIDSNQFTPPMTEYVEHPMDIDFHFSSINYGKAGAVLRMFWYMFGENAFMGGVSAYLKNNVYSDADEEDLFDAIAVSVWLQPEVILPPNGNVSEIMASWTRQAGYPIITVERNYEATIDQVTLRQERYYSFEPSNPDNSTWWVPYNLVTPSNPGFENTRAEGWIPQYNSSIEITIDSLGADDFLLLNKRAAGYYRVMYDERNYRLISDAIIRNSSLFHSTNIAQLLGDALEFYQTVRLPITSVLDLMRVLEFRSDYISWDAAFDTMFYLNTNMQGHRNFPIWADFIRSLTEELYDVVGVEDVPGESPLRKFARESVVYLACQMGSVHCRSDTTRKLRRYLETGEEFHHNIRQVLMCASLRSASRTDFNSLWNRLLELPHDDFIPRSEIIDMLACSTSRPLLNDYISSVFNETIYNTFERYSVINSVLRNGGNIGIDVALDFMIENAVQFAESFGAWFVDGVSNYISNAEHIERFVILLNILLDEGFLDQQQIDFNMEVIEVKVRWLNTQGEIVNTWLLDNFA